MHLRFGLLLALLLGAVPALRAEILYSVTDLGTLGNSSTPGHGINDLGQVTGSSGSHAFLYSNGQMTDLGTLGGPYSQGTGITMPDRWSALLRRPPMFRMPSCTATAGRQVLFFDPGAATGYS